MKMERMRETSAARVRHVVSAMFSSTVVVRSGRSGNAICPHWHSQRLSAPRRRRIAPPAALRQRQGRVEARVLASERASKTVIDVTLTFTCRCELLIPVTQTHFNRFVIMSMLANPAVSTAFLIFGGARPDSLAVR